MGKVIKIQGADYSNIALSSGDIDITNSFEWSSGKALNATTNALANSGYFDASNKVDISAYKGKTLVFTFFDYITSSNAKGSYGWVMSAEDGTTAVKSQVASIYKGDVITRPYGIVKTIEIIIPENANYFRTCYFGGTTGQALKTEPFKCIVKA